MTAGAMPRQRGYYAGTVDYVYETEGTNLFQQVVIISSALIACTVRWLLMFFLIRPEGLQDRTPCGDVDHLCRQCERSSVVISVQRQGDDVIISLFIHETTDIRQRRHPSPPAQ